LSGVAFRIYSRSRSNSALPEKKDDPKLLSLYISKERADTIGTTVWRGSFNRIQSCGLLDVIIAGLWEIVSRLYWRNATLGLESLVLSKLRSHCGADFGVARKLLRSMGKAEKHQSQDKNAKGGAFGYNVSAKLQKSLTEAEFLKIQKRLWREGKEEVKCGRRGFF
jgi:hypothetical protein